MRTATVMKVAATDSSLMGQRMACTSKLAAEKRATKKKQSTGTHKTRKRHTPDECKFKNAQCYGCGKGGHIKEA